MDHKGAGERKMAAHSYSADLEAQRAELEAVLKSEEFNRAPTLARMLSYLCERVFSGEADHIKEYSVGIDVFHRGSNFDQDSDSIVRVEANRLRKRLGQYYAASGSQHRLQIVIPVGQYVPKFELLQLSVPEDQSVPKRPVSEKSQHWWGRIRPRTWWLGAAFATVVLVVIGSTRLIVLSGEKRTPAAVIASDTAVMAPSPQVGIPAGEEIRILAGSDRNLVDHAGKLWSSDTSYGGGISVRGSPGHIGRTQEPAFYRNSRQGQFRYDIPLKKGLYELHLHFAETAFGPEAAGLGGEGSRVMSVRANGRTLLAGFDVVADAGASRVADVRVFPGIRPANDGQLHLEFSGEEGKQAMVSAIEIMPGVGERIRPIRIVARQSPYYSNDSHWWSPDNYFEGGQLATYPVPVKGTDDAGLYETERWGNFSYAIPVAPGKYSVTLHFTARGGDSTRPSSALDETSSSARHVFNVFCNGRALLESFDLAKEARKADVVIRKFTGLEPNAQGKLLFNFIPVEGYATVTALEVIPQ